MKKIIALVLCGTTSYSFGLNLNVAKPNTGYSWTSLSSTQRYIMFAASVLALVGVTYFTWPKSKSEEDALIEADAKRSEWQEDIITKSTTFNLEAIKKGFEEKKISPVIFPFGFLNRNEFKLSIKLKETPINEMLKKTDMFIELSRKNPSQTTRYLYDADNKRWNGPIIF